MNRTRLSILAVSCLLLGLSAVGVGESDKEEARGSATAVDERKVHATHKLSEAREALIAAGLAEEAESLGEIIKTIRENDDEDRPRGRWARRHSAAPEEGDGRRERVPSEISGLFREMFEIVRGVDEHQAWSRAIQLRAEQVSPDGDSAQANRELQLVKTRMRAERAEALNSLRERSPRLKTTIDRAIRNIDSQRSDDSASWRWRLTRERLEGLKSALDHAGKDDEEFYAALVKFVEDSRPPRPPMPDAEKPRGEPPPERVARVQREIRVLQDRLRELESELTRLHEDDSQRPRRQSEDQ